MKSKVVMFCCPEVEGKDTGSRESIYEGMILSPLCLIVLLNKCCLHLLIPILLEFLS